MALTEKTAELPLIGGLDTKTDSKQVKLGKLLSAQNIVYRNPGKINKREGFTSIGQTVLDGGQIDNGQALMNYADELLAFDKNNIYSYVESVNSWKDKGDFESAYVTSEPVSNGTSLDTLQDTAYHPSGLLCHIYNRVQLGVVSVVYQVTDLNTKQIIVGPVSVVGASQPYNPKVVCIGDIFVMYYYDGNDKKLYGGTLPIGNLTAAVLWTPLTDNAINDNSVLQTQSAYDVCAMTLANGNQRIYLTFNTNEVTPRIRTYAYSAASPLIPLFGSLEASGIVMGAVQLFYDGTGNGPATVYSDNAGTNVLRLFIQKNDLSATVITTNTTLAAGAVIENVTGISAGTALVADVRVFADYTIPSTGRYWTTAVKWNDIPAPLGTWTTLFATQQIALAGQAFLYNGKAYAWIVGGPSITTSGAQETYFAIDQNGRVIARFLSGLASGPNDINSGFGYDTRWLPRTPKLSDTTFYTDLRNVTTFGDISGTTQTGVTSLFMDFFEPERSYSNANIASSIYIGGGMLYQYDGLNLVEDGYNWQPRIGNMTSPGGTGNSYSYVAVWEWVDNVGNLHRSAPSTPYTVTTSSPISNSNRVTNIRLFPLSLTQKTQANNRSPIMCVLYRTLAGLPDYYKLSVSTANANNTSVEWITPADDGTTDAILAGREQLYANSQLPNDNAPPIGALTTYRNRLWALDSTNPLVIYYSKEVNFANTVEWSDAQVITVDPSGGDITGLAAMDDKLLIFKENSIRFLAGNGPDVNGANNDYGTTTLITTDAGCINLRSIVSTPEGVLFKSSKGIYFINRGLQVSYIGAPVERWNSNFITSGILMKDVNQVRITLDNNTILVYDYYVDNWATFTGLSAVDSAIWNDTHAFIRDTGKVMVETPNTYTDDGVTYPMEITTGWMNFGGVQGFQRLWKSTLLGEFKSPHQLQVSFYYDYNDNAEQTISVTPIAPSTYGSGSPYGSESPYGGTFQLYQYELRNNRQKCMSVKMKITDVNPTAGTLEEGYELSNIRLSYGVIGNSNRLKNSQVFG